MSKKYKNTVLFYFQNPEIPYQTLIPNSILLLKYGILNLDKYSGIDDNVYIFNELV